MMVEVKNYENIKPAGAYRPGSKIIFLLIISWYYCVMTIKIHEISSNSNDENLNRELLLYRGARSISGFFTDNQENVKKCTNSQL
jgi:hypothetical protein